jgi:DNA-binding HxlR family transcriptional regulator
VVRDLVFMGRRRFSEFHAAGEGIATNVLSDRLQRLQDAGVIDSAQDPDDRRRVLYHLTESGLDLIPTLIELVRWGAKHDGQTGAPAKFIKRLKKDREGVIAELAAHHRAQIQN